MQVKSPTQRPLQHGSLMKPQLSGRQMFPVWPMYEILRQVSEFWHTGVVRTQHCCSSPPHSSRQTPATHWSLPVQRLPQAPQLFGSSCSGTQVLPQKVVPMPHIGTPQLPWLQLTPAAQARPHIPQCCEFVPRS